MKDIVIVLVCTKSLKLFTSEENIISIQQLPSCLPLLFGFSFEVLKSDIKSCFDGVVFQDAVILLHLCVVFLLHREFPYACCCKDCKNIIRDKKFLHSRLFCLFFRLCKFLPELFKLVARKYHFSEYKKFFQSGYFYFLNSESSLLKQKKNMRLGSSIPRNKRNFFRADFYNFFEVGPGSCLLYYLFKNKMLLF